MNTFPSAELPGRRRPKETNNQRTRRSNAGPGRKKGNMTAKASNTKPQPLQGELVIAGEAAPHPDRALHRVGPGEYLAAEIDLNGVPVGPVRSLTVREALVEAAAINRWWLSQKGIGVGVATELFDDAAAALEQGSGVNTPTLAASKPKWLTVRMPR
ncbi:MAG: hypothetical protein KIT22_09425 [Verrucomicrobiae bacterium]|nr:hypothetical protein [Verrucomicrobiae bacterium]